MVTQDRVATKRQWKRKPFAERLITDLSIVTGAKRSLIKQVVMKYPELQCSNTLNHLISETHEVAKKKLGRPRKVIQN